ncbi:helix-turn-helix domain-containing protein [Occultella kanbiaonis]|uniref:helix-turn-helix domain-containing protein n=1 Tax=Occultella kanbiaonis TaxID=2675754 RepID=UPI001F1A246C|nr:helix-turn-helix transcriptional regulator [Occultella kanbiaonis]
MSATRDAIMSRSVEELVELATRLATEDEELLYRLVEARKDAGLSQRDVAEMLEIKQSSIAAFERHDNDPKLSTIRRYALAVGATVEHHVSSPAWDEGWDVQPSFSIEAIHVGGASQVTTPAPLTMRADHGLAA